MGDSTLLYGTKAPACFGLARAGRNEYKFRLNAAAESAGSVFMSSSVIFFLVLVMCQPSCLFAQTVLRANQSHGGTTLPKPAVDLIAGIWKYKVTTVQGDGIYFGSYSITIKDDGEAWTVTYIMDTPSGPVTLVSTLEKGTLILRKELFKHFAKPGDAGPFTINLDFTGNKVTGTSNRSGRDNPIAIDFSGPFFAGEAVSQVTIGCLPLKDGYSTTFRNFDVQRLKEKLLQIKVVGIERVTVPAGTFDSYKVELTSADGGSNKGTVWIAKDSRRPVKSSFEDSGNNSSSISSTTELVP